MTDAQTVRAVGSSMVPFVLPGSILEVIRPDAQRIEAGDLVCYIDDVFPGTVHRVVRIQNNGDSVRLWVRGDAHQMTEEIPMESVVYVVRRVSFGPVAYRCDSPMGNLIKRLATSNRFPAKVVQSLLTTAWQSASWVGRAVHLRR